jgi:hypothetical protein
MFDLYGNCRLSGRITVLPVAGIWRSASRNTPTSTAHSVRSSSQSISSSAKVRVLGFPLAADRVGAVEVGEHQDMEKFGARSGTKGVEALPESALKFVGTHPA